MRLSLQHSQNNAQAVGKSEKSRCVPNPPIVLSSRPTADDRLTAFAQSNGLMHLHAPVMRIETIACTIQLPAQYGAIFTSANAVRSLVPSLKSPPCFIAAVGQKTADSLTEFGYVPDVIAPDIAALFNKMPPQTGDLPLVHFRGDHTACDLMALGRVWAAPIVYRQIALDWPPDIYARLHAAANSGQRVIAPVYSPRSAQLLCTQFGHVQPNMPQFAVASISARAALQMQRFCKIYGLRPLAMATAPTPDQAGMGAALDALTQSLGERL